LIADYLKARGIEVTHIVDLGKTEAHPFTSAAQVVKGELSYTAIASPTTKARARGPDKCCSSVGPA
jgi:uncharacterized protein (DUF488 family)